MDKQTLAAYIDHTLLKATTTPQDIEKLCQEGNAHQFASICVNGCYVALAARVSKIPVAAVVGFPLGAMSTAAKVAETKQAVADGASEVDMVINLGWAKAGEWERVEQEIRQVVAAAGCCVKVIIETAYLTDEEKELACLAAKRAGAQFVKTSTGFAGGGATVADVALMRRVVGDELGVKASGGIRDLATALALIEAGATRLGASAGVSIAAELED